MWQEAEGILMESMLEGFKRSNGHKNLITIKAADSMC